MLILSSVLLTLAGGALAPPTLAFTPRESVQAPAIDRATLRADIEKLVAQALENEGAVGLSVAVAIGDEFILAGGFGVAEAEHSVPADAKTLFRIGSITKQFTSAAIMRLCEEEKLDLGQLLKDFVPDYPVQGHEVTLVHLLTHTSGIKSYTGLGEEWRKNVPLEVTHEELLALFAPKPFDFPPGERFRYNNSGYYLLGMIIEKASGESYGDYIRKHLCEPAGLLRTRYGSNADLIKNRAQGYRMVDGKLANDELIGMSQPGAAGAILSTAEELVLWQLAFVGGKIVTADSYELMTMPFMLNSGVDSNYGFGLQLGSRKGQPIVSHGGGINGFNSQLSYHPESKLSIAVISNCEGYSAGGLAREITRVVLD